jgi:hypothetical protein
LEEFRQKAFEPQFPAHLPSQPETSIAAQHEWFNRTPAQSDGGCPQAFSLKQDFWSKYRDIFVLLHWMDRATDKSSQRLYLAQCHLADLPQSLRDDVPTPQIVQEAGKGDVYDANLWMGLAPTYTPLHRDPNPNLFLQLAGRKVVRLFRPDVGASIFTEVQKKLGRNASNIFRSEEMMQGAEKELLERQIWSQNCNLEDGFEATLDHGQALFIPLGWWHSIKGVGKGVTASVNWWFR